MVKIYSCFDNVIYDDFTVWKKILIRNAFITGFFIGAGMRLLVCGIVVINVIALAEASVIVVLYQIEGSLNGVDGRFEWIIQDGKVTHRMFVKGGTINGVPKRL